MPMGFYLPEQVAAGTESVFVRGFGAGQIAPTVGGS
jgi:hypothetical protein